MHTDRPHTPTIAAPSSHISTHQATPGAHMAMPWVGFLHVSDVTQAHAVHVIKVRSMNVAYRANWPPNLDLPCSRLM